MAQRYVLDSSTGQWKSDASGEPQFFRGLYIAAGCVAACVVLVPAFLLTSAALADARRSHSIASTTPRPARLGGLAIGAYSAEAASLAGLPESSIDTLGDEDSYQSYRDSVRRVYGADLEDMNYFGIGLSNWLDRLPKLESWLTSAGRYGSVTLALEPLGPTGFRIFRPGSEMSELRKVFQRVGKRGVVVYVRFASEANITTNPYSVFGSEAKSKAFYEKAKWFRSYMPSNVKLVFSPLINTVVGTDQDPPTAKQRNLDTARWMFVGDGQDPESQRPWSRVGGTLYRTNLPLEPTYEAYYRYFAALAPHTPFQLCELGGPQSKRAEMLSFLRKASKGQWPQLTKINLFAGHINALADPEQSFGFISAAKEMKQSEIKSWLEPHLIAERVLDDAS